MKYKQTKIKVIEGSIFDFSSNILLVGTNIFGACESPGAVLSQVMSQGGIPFTMHVRGLLNKVNGNLKYSNSVVSVPVGLNNSLYNAGFTKVCIGFPVTGSVLGFKNTLKNFAKENEGSISPVSVTMPLIATNVGGIPIEEWVVVVREFVGESKKIGWLSELTIVVRPGYNSNKLSLIKSLEK